MHEPYDSVIVDVVVRALVPLIQLFALYVLTFGHYSPGGGFQAGALLAASVLLTRISLGREESCRLFPTWLAPVFATSGVLLYSLTGAVAMLAGGAFLDYGHLPIPGMHGSQLRYEGILLVEVGVALTVNGVLVLIYDRITEQERG